MNQALVAPVEAFELAVDALVCALQSGDPACELGQALCLGGRRVLLACAYVITTDAAC